ncbi:ribonuclease toxin immunity protein CdiI [Priestia filamentosa]|uniref:ribonuclease toxin immunity protein CdiI n=1 Tax=Priestia filamentosa TaxID=1402861 RepID=UPI001FD1DAEC|nr:ribonuclease toxin immunity protein CdiI [Priestia filamentosa]
MYLDEYEQDDEKYFGQNKVLFYSGDGDNDYGIVNYDELYQYLRTACEFYVGKNPEKKEIVEELLMKIKEKYNIK